MAAGQGWLSTASAGQSGRCQGSPAFRGNYSSFLALSLSALADAAFARQINPFDAADSDKTRLLAEWSERLLAADSSQRVSGPRDRSAGP